MKTAKRTLILGYGNADRQDDGVAWHIFAGIARRLGRPAPSSPDEPLSPIGESPQLWFTLQLTPEMAETIAEYDRICFVDAHTGSVPQDLHIIPLSAQYQNSPFTHHMTPSTCLAFAETLYGNAPRAILVSVRGYRFGFQRSLSPKTEALAEQAIQAILDWLEQE